MMRYFDEVNEKLTNFLSWQESAEGRKTNLPKIDKAQKLIIFQEWKIRMKHVEATVNEARYPSNSIIKYVNDNLLHSNLVSSYQNIHFQMPRHY